MTLQAIRSALEQPVIAAFAPVPVYVENQLYADNQATTEFALLRLQWGLMNESSIGCRPGELLRGVVIVELFTAKGTGPGRAQDLITPVMAALAQLNGMQTGAAQVKVGQLTGPSFTPLNDRPHLMTSLSAPLRARYDVP